MAASIVTRGRGILTQPFHMNRLSHALRKRGMSGGGTAVMKAERLWWRCKMRHFAGATAPPHNRQSQNHPASSGPQESERLVQLQPPHRLNAMMGTPRNPKPLNIFDSFLPSTLLLQIWIRMEILRTHPRTHAHHAHPKIQLTPEIVADHSRGRIKAMSSKRPNGAYGTVQPLNIAAERERFLLEAAQHEEGTRAQPPSDPQFVYADSDRCQETCPAMSCTCARGRMWAEYGEPDSSMMPQALAILQIAAEAGVLPGSSSGTRDEVAAAQSPPGGHGGDDGGMKKNGKGGNDMELRQSSCGHGVHDVAGSGAGAASQGEESSSSSNGQGGPSCTPIGILLGDMSEDEAERDVQAYLERHGIQEVVRLEWLEKDMCSVPSMRTRIDVVAEKPVTGKLHLVRGAPIRQQRLKGLLDHEIGTHFLRAYNEHTRRGLPMAHTIDGPEGAQRRVSALQDLETEEGLATLNTHYSAKNKVLWSPALSYVVQARSRDVGFTALFMELKQFIPSAASRWAFCMRSKRGLRDTSQPGGMAKDKVYLQGALKILMHRRELDFTVLHSGKITLTEHEAARKHLRSVRAFRPRAGGGGREKLVMPHFVRDAEAYLAQLDLIAKANGVAGTGFQGTGVPPTGGMLNLPAGVAGVVMAAAAFPVATARRGGEDASLPQALPVGALRLSRRSATSLGLAAAAKDPDKWDLLAAPSGSAARLAAKLGEEDMRSRAKRRAMTETRLHALDRRREQTRKATLDKCFSKKSRWGGLAFSWD